MKDAIKVSLVGMLCVTAMTMVAISLGHDGALLSTAFTVVGGIAGYGVKTSVSKLKNKAPESTTSSENKPGNH